MAHGSHERAMGKEALDGRSLFEKSSRTMRSLT